MSHDEKQRSDILDELFGAPVSAKTPEEEQSESAPTPEETAKDMPAADPAEEGDTLEFDTPAVGATQAEPEEDDVKVYHAPIEDEDRQTRVMPAPGGIAGAEPLADEPEEEVPADQILWDDLDENQTATDPAEAGTAPDHDPELKEAFRKSRESKVRSFRLIHGAKIAGDEAADKPEEPQPEAETDVAETEPETEPEADEEYVEDFTQYEDAEVVETELRYRRSRGWLCLLASIVWEFLLLMNLVGYRFGVYTSPLTYVIVSAVLLLIMAGFNFPLLRDGWEDLRERRFGGETAVLFSVVIALIHTLAQLANLSTVSGGLLPALAGFGLLLGAIGRQLSLIRLGANFGFLKDPDTQKWAATRIEDEKTAVEIGRAAVALGQPDVAYYRPASFLGRFLEHSYERPETDRALPLYAAIAGGASLVIALAYGLVTKEWWQAVYLMAAGLCLSAPVVLSLAPAAAQFRAARSALRHDGMIVGADAMKEFGDLHALVVEAGELFPDNAVLLNGIKTFAGNRIDEAILDAAAVVIAAGGPLSHVFRRIIENKIDILPEVDTLVYEQEMGLSGWVGGRRVLVGNRRLLENHGVDVPSNDYEMRYTKSGRKVVYLSTAGQLSAMFVVTYVADETVVRTLQALNKEGVTLLVHTCDSNVTEELIASTLHLKDYYIEILHAAARLRYEELLREDLPQPDAVLASGNGLPGKAIGVARCRRLRKGLKLTLIVSLLMAMIGLGLMALLAFSTHALPSTLLAIGYTAVSALVVLLVQLIRMR